MNKTIIKAQNREELDEKIKRLITLEEDETVKIKVLKEPKKILFFNMLGSYEIEIIKKSEEKYIPKQKTEYKKETKKDKKNDKKYNKQEKSFENKKRNNNKFERNNSAKNNSQTTQQPDIKNKNYNNNNKVNGNKITEKDVNIVNTQIIQEENDDTINSNYEKIRSFMKEFIVNSKLDIVIVNIEKINERYIVNLDGKDMRYLIGEKGSSLNSIEYLLTAVNDFKNIKVVIDSNNYKQKREESLRDLARKKGKKVLDSGKMVKLNPMSARERKIIHEEISFIKGLKTESVGEEPRRYLVIKKIREDKF